MNAWHEWDAAFRALVQDNNVRPLVALLRGGRPVPSAAAYALAELFDPQVAWSPYAKPRLPPPDQFVLGDDGKPVMFVPSLRFVLGDDGKPIPYSGDDGRPTPRLKAAIECEAAWMAVLVECERLAAIYNERHEDKLEKWDVNKLEAFAEERVDEKALTAFANHREARAKLSAEKAAVNPAVELVVKPLSKKRRARLSRNDRIVSEMLADIQPLFGPRRSANEVAQRLGEKFGLSDRQVKAVWAAARKAMPPGFLEDFGKPLVK